MPTTHTALRADKTYQKVELRSSKNASLSTQPSVVSARTQLIMFWRTINNDFRSLGNVNLKTDLHLFDRSTLVFCAVGATTTPGDILPGFTIIIITAR